MKEQKVWLDGRVLPAAEAGIPAGSPGVLLGLGVFETLLWDGGPQALHRHWKRLYSGLIQTGLPPVSEDLMRTALEEVYTAHPPDHRRLRFTVLAAADGGVHCLGTCSPPKPWPAVEKVVVSSWVHNNVSPLAGVKSTSYAAHWITHEQAVKDGFGEALLFNTCGGLCEGSASNVFLVKPSGQLVTPPLTSGCLPGVTREILLEVMPDIVEADVSLEELNQATELFITSSTRAVQAVGLLGERPVPVVNGPVTQSARAALLKALSAEL